MLEYFLEDFFEQRLLEHFLEHFLEKDLETFGTMKPLCMPGQKEYEEARRAGYGGTDVLLISFSLVEPHSLNNVINLWAKETNLYVPKNVPVSQSLVCTHSSNT